MRRWVLIVSDAEGRRWVFGPWRYRRGQSFADLCLAYVRGAPEGSPFVDLRVSLERAESWPGGLALARAVAPYQDSDLVAAE